MKYKCNFIQKIQKQKSKLMKKISTLLILGTILTTNAQNGTQPDSSRMIVGSQVVRTIDVLANDILVSAKTYTLDTFYKSASSPSIILTKNGNSINFQTLDLTATDDSFFYVVKDQFGGKDTNFVIVRKSNLNLDLYPGDANKDNICNNIDVLNIGIAYGKTEIAREGIYKTDNWGPVRAYDWTFSNQKSNYRYSDADGNGVVDSASDIAVIYKNYSTTSGTTNITYSPSGGQNFVIALNDTFKVDATNTKFQIDLRLGSTTSSQYCYGVAFTLKYDNTIFKANNIQFNPSKWFADQQNTLNFARVNHSKGEFDLAIVRRNGGNENGSGSLGIVDVIVEEILGGLSSGINTNLEITKAVLIDSAYNLLPVTLASPKPLFLIKKSASGISNVKLNALSIEQDQNQIFIQNFESKKSEVKIYSILGNMVYKSKDWEGDKMSIDTKYWNSGIYIIQYKNEYHKLNKF